MVDERNAKQEAAGPTDRECVIGYVGELRKLTADQVRELADDGCRGWNGVLNRILAAAGAL